MNVVVGCECLGVLWRIEEKTETRIGRGGGQTGMMMVPGGSEARGVLQPKNTLVQLDCRVDKYCVYCAGMD